MKNLFFHLILCRIFNFQKFERLQDIRFFLSGETRRILLTRVVSSKQQTTKYDFRNFHHTFTLFFFWAVKMVRCQEEFQRRWRFGRGRPKVANRVRKLGHWEDGGASDACLVVESRWTDRIAVRDGFLCFWFIYFFLISVIN